LQLLDKRTFQFRLTLIRSCSSVLG